MAQTHYGLDITRVALRVKDLDAMVAFYEEVVGLAVFKKDGEMALLGVGVTPLVEMRRDPHATPQPEAPGLYHTAFLLPSRGDLGAWLGKAIRGQVALDGASDHGVSEAIYLTDPEGNGIEIYADRPETSWGSSDPKRRGPRRLDVKQLLSTSPLWRATPTGTRIGHVHLQVGDLEAAQQVFVDGLGLDVTNTLPGMRFFSAGGYHHHFGANTHHSRGIERPDGVATGLIRVDLEFADRTDLPEGIDAPWGTHFAINKRQRLAA